MQTIGQKNFGAVSVVVIKLTILLIFAGMTHQARADANYVNFYFPNKPSIGISVNNLRFNDILVAKENCENASYKCFQSTIFSLAIPINVTKRSWSSHGAHYKTLSGRQMLVRNEMMFVRVIRQSIGDNILTVVHSDKLGLLSLKGEDGSQLDLVEECGVLPTAKRENGKRSCIN